MLSGIFKRILLGFYLDYYMNMGHFLVEMQKSGFILFLYYKELND